MLFLKKGYRFIKKSIDNFFNYTLLRYYKVAYKKKPKINGLIRIIGHNKITLGENVRIKSSLSSNPVGLRTKTILVAIGNGKITIGDNVGISNSLIWSKKEIIIEDNVLIGGGCQIFDNDFHSLDYEDRVYNGDKNVKSRTVIIQEGVFIGTGSIILKGVIIGRRSIVAAGSVVSKSIPEGEIWGGNPAVFLKKII